MAEDGKEYTNDSNPFGDTNLLSEFRWHKKEERERALGIVRKRDAEDLKKQAEELKVSSTVCSFCRSFFAYRKNWKKHAVAVLRGSKNKR